MVSQPARCRQATSALRAILTDKGCFFSSNMSSDRFESLQDEDIKQCTQIQQILATTGRRSGDASATVPPVLYMVINGQCNTETERNSLLALKHAEEVFKSEVISPFDGALEVGLADCAVVYEYRRAGAELFSQSSRGDL